MLSLFAQKNINRIQSQENSKHSNKKNHNVTALNMFYINFAANQPIPIPDTGLSAQGVLSAATAGMFNHIAIDIIPVIPVSNLKALSYYKGQAKTWHEVCVFRNLTNFGISYINKLNLGYSVNFYSLGILGNTCLVLGFMSSQ